MREIKFRAWDKENSKWMNSSNIEYYVSKEGDNYFMVIGGRGKYKYELNQYTGLKDKNGKEIYEGDILEDCNVKVKGLEVFWNNEAGGFWYKRKDHSPAGALPIYVCAWEVIGNIYENPELLEVEK